MNSLYLNNNEFSYFCKEYGGSKTRMSSSFLWLPPDPRHARRYTRGRTCGVCASEGRTKAVPCVPCGRAWQRRSEDGATPRRGYSIPSKKVRAKDSISAQKETSRSVRSLRDRAGRSVGAKIRRRCATKSDGADTARRAVLSLF
jgi:hypothetical protein